MRTARIAVVGSGPAGIYAADALVRAEALRVHVDVIDRLPTPYGLVRYGVAPDHPRIKSITGTLQRVLQHDRVRFLGDVELGTTVTAEELDNLYDAVVYATGAAHAQPLDIPGETLPGSWSATELVSWYSGHPDSAATISLDVSSVAVIGAGNVALDVARLLVKTPAELAATDMPTAVLECLAGSAVRDVHIICRRGPEHARFTTKELRELGDLHAAGVVIDGNELPESDAELPPTVRSNLAVLRQLAARPGHDRPRRIHLHFWQRPTAIIGTTTVTGLRLEGTEPTATGGVRGTGTRETLPVGMVVRAVGYRSTALPGLPFDATRGVIPNDGGRILDDTGRPWPGRYVTGWVKRGPSGVVGTNRACAVETVQHLLDDLTTRPPTAPTNTHPIDRILASRGRHVVDFHGWLRIDAGEIELGHTTSRERSKITDWSTLRRLGAATD
ncbi:NADP oxidoreductase [Micromonospora zingiberis]|uniref:ferredoxin--NADP(+) reductase n=1 Tax=Micromonospora zingiberis TaxID=2053011 RepID=A0A4R0GNJ4_9ACTN|nr:FAD-dependent oxidoreductase [Micromonospora zingiberis]TCB97209.1 NADP oxidoreductase [Micromonospora zingiberis]